MSAGGGMSSSTTGTRDVPKWATSFLKNSILPFGQQSIDTFNAEGGAGGGPLRDQAGKTLSNEITGKYLDPSNDPALQKMEADTQAQAATQFQSDLNAIEGNANKSGALFSSGVPAAEAQAAKELATNVGAQTAQLENQNYQQQAGYQAGAIGQAAGWNQQALNDYLQALNSLHGISSTSGTSGWSANVTI